MSPHFTYRRSAAAAWKRIDLLLTIYEVGLQCAHGALEAIDNREGSALVRHRLKFYRVLLQILDGLDDSAETSANIRRLVLFMFDKSNSDQPEDWQAILRILQPLRDGFAAIREQAVELEEQGLIPPADAATVNLSA